MAIRVSDFAAAEWRLVFCDSSVWRGGKWDGNELTSRPASGSVEERWLSRGRTARLPSQHGGRRRRRGTAPAWPSPPANPAPPSSRAPAPWAVRRLDAWLDDRQLEDRTLASYRRVAPRPGPGGGKRLARRWPRRGFRARLAGEPSPTGERTGPSPGRLPAARRRSRPGGDFSGRRTWPPSSPPRGRRRVRNGRPRDRPRRRPVARRERHDAVRRRRALAAARKGPRSRPPAGPGNHRYPAPGVESDAQLRRAWGRTVRLPPIGGTGGASASPAVAASWAGARSESRRPAVEPTRRTATMTSCLGVREAASETDDDLQAAGRGGRRIGGRMRTLGPRTNADERNLLAERNAAIDDDGEDGGAVEWARDPRRPVAGRHRAHRGGCRRHDQRTACRCGRQWRAPAGFRHSGDR